MKRYFSYFGIGIFVAFSFYFTDKISTVAFNKNELVKKIKDMQTFYYEEAEDAKIDLSHNTIIPGKFGKKINTTESYLNMSDFKIFNEGYLVFDLKKPNISLENNKDKFIISGNPKKRNVSLLVADENKFVDYFLSNKIKFSIINKNNTKYRHFINAASNETDFKLLNRFAYKSKFCLKHFSIIRLCKKYNYYLIDTNVVLQREGFNKIKSKIKSGAIIIINNDVTFEDLTLLISEIRFKDLEIVSITKLISERE